MARAEIRVQDVGRVKVVVRIITMYIYHALINALSSHMIRINLNTIFQTPVEHRK